MNKVKNGYKLIAYYLSLFIIFIGFILLLPLFMLIFYPNELPYAYCFIIPGIGSIIIGFILFFIFKNCEKKNLERHQDAVFVVSIWLIAILFASFPFLLKGDNTFTQCIFEACSGFSTTGFTILDVEMTPYIFLFFRDLMLFVGGVGLILIITCAISDRFGLRLYNAEGHNDKLLPNIAKSARIIFLFYFVFILVGTVALILCKVDPFDAFSHAIAAVSTGGFSTKNNCIAFYDNVWVEIILCILMILGGTSFVIHLSFFKGKFKNVFFDGEIRFLYITLLIAIPLGALLLLNNCVGIEICSMLDDTILESYPNMIVVKSISKSYGVPGLRLGIMASADEMLIKEAKKYVSIWNINSFAEFFMQIFTKYSKDYHKACGSFHAERADFISKLCEIPFMWSVMPTSVR